MTNEEGLRAAVAVGVLGSEGHHRELLQAIVQVARAIFGAQASSIMLFDETTDELVFEAVARSEDRHLLGRRIPSSSGIAGWVLVTRQPLVLEDVQQDPRFAKGVAEETGYMPRGLMAVPLLSDERTLGVLQVLDRPQSARFSLQEMELLGLFANQAAIALDLLQHARRAEAVLGESGGAPGIVARLAARVDALEGDERDAGLRLLSALADVLGA